jgi:hypothetical protein
MTTLGLLPIQFSKSQFACSTVIASEAKQSNAGGQSESVPTIQGETADGWWARRKGAFAHPTESISNGAVRRRSFAISPHVCARFILEFPAF